MLDSAKFHFRKSYEVIQKVYAAIFEILIFLFSLDLHILRSSRDLEL